MARRLKRALFALLLLAAFSAQAELPDFKPFVRGSAKALSESRAGKPFILALWSVECVHCRAELAQLAALMRAHPRLDVVLVATDQPEARMDAQAILAQYDLARAERWIFADAFAERLRFEIDPRWRGELPRSYLYEPGKPPTALSGLLDEGQVSAWLRRAGL